MDTLSALSIADSQVPMEGQHRTLDAMRIESGATTVEEQAAGRSSCIAAERQNRMPEEQGSNNMVVEMNSFNMGSEGNSQRSPINGRGSSF